MNSLFTYSLYGIVSVLLIISFIKDKTKTLMSLKRAWKMFINVLPQFLAILLLIGLLLEVISPETIQHIIGAETGIVGMLVCSLLGAITLVPAVIAFPVAAEILKNGAGVAQIAVFISTLTTVGIVTLPLEMKYLGKKVSVLRNLLFYLFSFITAYIVGVILT
ncbi:MAG: permease [Lachnospiraceae bacterium]|nr:permease [Lachnospiraceae bacterium]